MDGYEKFFKQARKVQATQTGAPTKGRPTKPSTQFKMKSDREMDPGALRSMKSRSNSGLTPEDHLRRELAGRMKQKRQIAQRKKQKFPMSSAVCIVVAMAACGVGYFYPDSIEWAMKHVEFGAFGQAQAAQDSQAKPPPAPAGAVKPEEKSAAANTVAGEKSAETKELVKEGEALNVRNWTPEELSFFNKLNDRKKELDLREAELAKVEEELHRQKTELDEKIKQLETMRAEISKTLKTRVATDQEKVDKLVQVYSNMKPQQAAKVIETVNEDLAIEVLDKMKKKNAAEILNMMDAKKAQRLSEMLTGYRRSPAGTSLGPDTAESGTDGASDTSDASNTNGDSNKQ